MKILLAFLGTGNYTETTYYWESLSKTTGFFTEACVDFLQPDELLLFYTREAYNKNFAAFSRAMQAYPAVRLNPVEIPLGKNEEEAWQIFSLINQHIPDSSEVSLDVTNGQRSFPLLALLAAAFMKTGRGMKIKHLLYGAFNLKSDESSARAPVFDLSPMLDLLDWSIAADRFHRSGDSADIAALLEKESEAMKRRSNFNKKDALFADGCALSHLEMPFKQVTEALYLLRPYQTMQEIHRLNAAIQKAEPALGNTPQTRPLELLLDRIRDGYSPLAMEKPESTDPLAVIETLKKEREMILWYRDHGHWVQAVSLAREWLLSYVMLWLGKTDVMEWDSRESIMQDIHRYRKNKSEPGDAVTDDLIALFSSPKAFKDLWSNLVDTRNDIDHAGKNKNPKGAKVLIGQLKNCIDQIEALPLPEEDYLL